jgi:hypothetical protein
MKNTKKNTYGYFTEKLSASLKYLSIPLVNLPDTVIENPEISRLTYEDGLKQGEILGLEKGYNQGYQAAETLYKKKLANQKYELDSDQLHLLEDMVFALSLNRLYKDSPEDYAFYYKKALVCVRLRLIYLANSVRNQEFFRMEILNDVDILLASITPGSGDMSHCTVIPTDRLLKGMKKMSKMGVQCGKIEGIMDAYEKLGHINFPLIKEDLIELKEILVAFVNSGESTLYEKLAKKLLKRLDDLILKDETLSSMTAYPSIPEETLVFLEGRKLGKLEGYTEGLLDSYSAYGFNRFNLAEPNLKAFYERIRAIVPPQYDVYNINSEKLLNNLTQRLKNILEEVQDDRQKIADKILEETKAEYAQAYPGKPFPKFTFISEELNNLVKNSPDNDEKTTTNNALINTSITKRAPVPHCGETSTNFTEQATTPRVTSYSEGGQAIRPVAHKVINPLIRVPSLKQVVSTATKVTVTGNSARSSAASTPNVSRPASPTKFFGFYETLVD